MLIILDVSEKTIYKWRSGYIPKADNFLNINVNINVPVDAIDWGILSAHNWYIYIDIYNGLIDLNV